MNNNVDALESILECLRQKEILITNSLDLTKQIEVQSKQEEIEIDNLITNRQTMIDRMAKCDALIEKLLSEFDEEERIEWQNIILHKVVKTDDESKLCAINIVESIYKTCSSIVKINKNAHDNLNAELDEAKHQLVENRTKFSKDKIFN